MSADIIEFKPFSDKDFTDRVKPVSKLDRDFLPYEIVYQKGFGITPLVVQGVYGDFVCVTWFDGDHEQQYAQLLKFNLTRRVVSDTITYD